MTAKKAWRRKPRPRRPRRRRPPRRPRAKKAVKPKTTAKKAVKKAAKKVPAKKAAKKTTAKKAVKKAAKKALPARRPPGRRPARDAVLYRRTTIEAKTRPGRVFCLVPVHGCNLERVQPPSSFRRNSRRSCIRSGLPLPELDAHGTTRTHPNALVAAPRCRAGARSSEPPSPPMRHGPRSPCSDRMPMLPPCSLWDANGNRRPARCGDPSSMSLDADLAFEPRPEEGQCGPGIGLQFHGLPAVVVGEEREPRWRRPRATTPRGNSHGPDRRSRASSRCDGLTGVLRLHQPFRRTREGPSPHALLCQNAPVIFLRASNPVFIIFLGLVAGPTKLPQPGACLSWRCTVMSKDLLDLRPENVLEPAQGRLLVSEPFLSDPISAERAILLCTHDEQGAFGLVLNRSIEVDLDDLLPGHSLAGARVGIGGPYRPTYCTSCIPSGSTLAGSVLCSTMFISEGTWTNCRTW